MFTLIISLLCPGVHFQTFANMLLHLALCLSAAPHHIQITVYGAYVRYYFIVFGTLKLSFIQFQICISLIDHG